MNELERRRIATETILARFRGREFDWSTGRHCVSLARAQMRAMGHCPPSLPRVRSALAAKKALKTRDYASVTDMLDTLLPKIAPAEMLLGDLATMPGGGGLDAVFICAGPLKLFGWTDARPELAVVDVLDMSKLTGAWRV